MTPAPPTVSVVIPAFNASGYLGEALESVFLQTFQDLEVLVIDDGSTDDTRGMATSFGNRIRYFRQDQAGPAKARNRGIAESKGTFVAFLDADDRWLPTKLEEQIARFRAEPGLGLVTTGHQMFDSEQLYPPEKDKRALLFGHENVARSIFLHSNVATPTVMVPKRVFEDVGLFEEGIHIGEDDNLWIRIAASYPISLVDTVLVQCRLRPDSLTKDGDRFFRDVLKNIEWLTQKYPEVGRKIRDAVPEKLAGTYAEMGYFYFRYDRVMEAREALQTSLRFKPWCPRAWGYLLLSALPLPVIRILRSIKNKPN